MIVSLMLLATLMQEGRPYMVDRVAIKVNDKILTQRELVHLYRQKRHEMMAQYEGPRLDRMLKGAWRDTLRDAEQMMLFYEKAHELGMVPSREDIRSRLQSIRESNGLDEEQFAEVIFQQTGMTMDEYSDFFIRRDAQQAVIMTQVVRKIEVDDSEISKYYAEHKDEFMIPENYRIAADSSSP